MRVLTATVPVAFAPNRIARKRIWNFLHRAGLATPDPRHISDIEQDYQTGVRPMMIHPRGLKQVDYEHV